MKNKLTALALLVLVFTSINLAQAPVTPANLSTNASLLTTQVSWTAFNETSADGPYDVEYFGTDGTYTGLVSGSANQAGLSFIFGGPALVNNTTYYWQVRDADNDDITIGEQPGAWQQFSFKIEIATPTLTAPADLAVDVTSVSTPLSWSLAGGTGGVTFDLEIYNTTFLIWQTAVSNITSPYSGSSFAYNYSVQWRIVANKAGEPSKTSLDRTFTTELGAPVLALPANTSVNQNTTPTFTFTTPSWVNTTGASFNLEYHTGGGFPGTFVNGITSGYNGTTFITNTIVTWRVHATKPGFTTKTSAPFAFTTYSLPTPTPLNAATGVSQALPSLSWTAFDEGGFGNGNYDVEFDNDPLFGSIDATLSNTALTSLTLPVLAFNTAYYWRVRDTNFDGLGGDGTWQNFSFTTEIATPVLTGPANAALDIAIPASLTWTLAGGTGGVTYDLEYHTGGGFPGTLVPGVTSAYLFGGLTNNTTYTWRIISKKVGEPDKISTTRTFTTELGTPLSLLPLNLAVNQPTAPTFTWSLPGSSTGVVFNIEYHSGGGFPGTFINGVSSGYNGTTFTGNTTITWRVIATKPSFANKTGAPLSFTTLPSPTLLTPANLSSGVSIVPNFTWSWPGMGVPTYTLEIATDLAFTSIVYGPIAAAASPHQLADIDALDNGTIYYWRITATLPGPVSSSSIGKFTTILPALTQLVSPAFNNLIAGNIIGFQWTLPMGGLQYKLELDDNSNFLSQIPGFPTAYTNFNYYNFPYTLATLPAGSYFWRIKSYTAGGLLVSISSTWSFTIAGPPTAIPAYPTNLTTVYTTSPTIYWYLNNYFYNSGVYYRVRYATTPGGPYNLGTSPITTNNYITLPGLSVGSTYYYVIDASTSAGFGTSTTSVEGSFVVFYYAVASIPIYQSYPILGTTVYTLTPTLYWYLGLHIPGVTFDVQVDNSGNTFPSPEINAVGVSGYEYTTASLTAGSNYWWRVRINGSPTWYGPETFTVHSSATNSLSSSAVAIPILASPVGGIVVTTQSPTLSWAAYSTSPLEYQVIYSSDPTLNLGVLTNITLPTGSSSGWLVSNSYSLSGLTPGVTYYWQVRSRLASPPNTVSNYSSVGQFTVSPGASPIVVLPANPIAGSKINSNAANLSWVVPAQSSSILTYDLEISKNQDMTSAMLVSNLKQPNYKVSNLSTNEKYYWRVRSKTNSGSISDYSYKGEFSTGSATAVKEEAEIPTEFELSQNYPNPFNPSTLITFSITNNSFVSLKVYDILGREVKTLVSNDLNIGKYTINWNGDDNSGNKVATGTYIYRINAGNITATKKMILIK